jgi:hypothetical protein
MILSVSRLCRQSGWDVPREPDDPNVFVPECVECDARWLPGDEERWQLRELDLDEFASPPPSLSVLASVDVDAPLTPHGERVTLFTVLASYLRLEGGRAARATADSSAAGSACGVSARRFRQVC